MMCPYCVRPVMRWHPALWIGHHKVHADCQQMHEEHDLPYLLPDGRMQCRDRIVSSATADAVFGLRRRLKAYASSLDI